MDEPTTLPTLFQRATDAASHIRTLLPKCLQQPKVAIVCGSGLGGLADALNSSPRIETPYGDIPGFAVSTGRLLHIQVKQIIFKELGIDSIRKF
jgi:purine-nucleoside phosphorylase